MCARLVGELYGHIFQYIGDSFLEYRVRKLIEKGTFIYEESLEAMRNYKIKLSWNNLMVKPFSSATIPKVFKDRN